jgi:hypothetical protein
MDQADVRLAAVKDAATRLIDRIVEYMAPRGARLSNYDDVGPDVVLDSIEAVGGELVEEGVISDAEAAVIMRDTQRKYGVEKLP